MCGRLENSRRYEVLQADEVCDCSLGTVVFVGDFNRVSPFVGGSVQVWCADVRRNLGVRFHQVVRKHSLKDLTFEH